ncbi:beta strand repeat-containing protein [Thalassobellus suaedae]|uniref:DUF1566 domain-containing protein n=1 Tax=Thalassobellus suaedae TaxID=3074124 RepID=A0ABY9XTB2_9FLAO|nr:DUF1566 domain-containing protein [Flavobacteriaceae bacterium HL-DH14]
MKKLIFLVFLFTIGFQSFSQTTGINYQAVILSPNTKELPGENAQSNILANSNVTVQFTILDNFGNEEYQEYHQTSTDAFGMINLLISQGTITGGNSFEDIMWNGESKKLRVDIDFSATASNYTNLSVNELTFMPQPLVGEDARALNNNTIGLEEEINRAINAELDLKDEIDQNKEDIEAITAVNADGLGAEIIRATAAEGAIVNNLDAEIDNREAADTGLQRNIDAVQVDVDQNESDSYAADSTLQRNIDNLETNSNTAIAAVQSDVDQNESDSDAADTILQNNIDTLESSTDTAIATVQSDVDQNELDRDAADTILQNNIDTLESDTDTAMTAVQEDVDANETASVNADATLQSNIDTVQSDVDTNEADSDAADATLQNNIDALETSSTAAITAVQDDVDANETASVNADATLQSNIDTVQSDVDTNEADSDAADATLQNNIDALETSSTAAIKVVQDDVDSNETASVIADAALQSNIDTVQSDVDTNEADSDAADATLQNNIDALETSSTAAITAVQDDVDANKTASVNADAALQSNIDTVQSDVDTNEADSDAADATLQSNIDTLETNSNTAIETVQTDVDQNELDSDTADTTLQNNIDALETSSTAAITAVQDDVDANEIASAAADASLQGELDATQTGAGLGTDGSYTANASTNYMKTSTSLVSATEGLDTQIKTNADAIALKANLASPTFTGTPLAPTATTGTSTTQLATTAFVSEAFDTVISDGVAAQTLSIGDFVGGGVVFWVDPVDNSRGLVCSIEDQSAGIQWYNGSYLTTGATGTAVETGASNTDAIIAVQGATETNYAAGLARAYTGGGFTDWYLPSKDELYQMGLNRGIINSIASTNGGVNFGGGSRSYWSSTETGSNAWVLFFGNLHQTFLSKNETKMVRAVRAVGFPAISSLTTITAEQAAQNTAIDLKANLASPTFTGTPLAPTATVGTNTTQIATTAFVTAAASSSNFVDLATDQTIAGVKTFSGDAIVEGILSTPNLRIDAGKNYWEFSINSGSLVLKQDLDQVFSIGADGNGYFTNNLTANSFIKTGGTASQFLKADGTVDVTTYAPLASPTFTGTPTLPTGTIGVTQTAGDNTTALATTAYVDNSNTTNANLTGMVTSVGNATTVVTNANLTGQ